MANEGRIGLNVNNLNPQQGQRTERNTGGEIQQKPNSVPQSPKENAGRLLDRAQQNLQAGDRKNELLSKLNNGNGDKHADRTSNNQQQKAERTAEKTLDRAARQTEKAQREVEKTERKIEQQTAKAERTAEKTEKQLQNTAEKSERNLNKTENRLEKPEKQIERFSERTADKTVRHIENADRNINKSIDKSAERTFDEADRFYKTTGDKTGKQFEKVEKQLDKFGEKLERELDKTFDKTNRFYEKTAEKTEKQFDNVRDRFERHLDKTFNTAEKHFENYDKPLDKFTRHFEKPENFDKDLKQTFNQMHKTLDVLIDRAKEHHDFERFRNQGENFWRGVREMSDVKILKSEFRGDIQIRVFSRYAELIERFAREGGKLDQFLNSLPRHEREVFLARFQMEKTFGAGKFFVHDGLVLTERGEFALKNFLQAGGKTSDLPASILFAFANGDLPIEEFLFLNNSLFAGQLFASKGAALLSLTLALAENINQMLPLEVLLSNAALTNLLSKNGEFALSQLLNNFAANQTTPQTDKRANEQILVGALIGGALSKSKTTDESQSKIRVAPWQTGEQATSPLFAAGATGAMLGAAIGCLVPLAETAAGAALNYAASVVVGSTERGLRSLSVSTLISDVVTSGVQTLLNASQTAFAEDSSPRALSSAAFGVDDLQFDFGNRRRNALLTA